MGGDQMQTIYGMISDASEKKSDRLFYRTLFGTKQLPMSVIDIEYLKFITPTLPKALQEISIDLQDIFIKSLTSTTSIRGQMLNVLTTNRSRIEVANPATRKNMMNNLLRQAGGTGDEYG